ncbi:MAG: glycoside hydrolase family 15 protein [Alphaproteobacteria bacterium]
MTTLELGLIGNSSFGALVDPNGRVVWMCLPRFDGDPVFCSLLQPGETPEAGFFDLEVADLARSEQEYLTNSAILRTRLYDGAGNAVEITDFAPRFRMFGRMFRPLTLVRRIRPLAGHPLVRIRLRPTFGYGAQRPATTRGSNHVRYVAQEQIVRLTTNAPISVVTEELQFVLEEPVDLILGPDETMASRVEDVAREFFDHTLDYWREWSRYLSIPFEWQDAVLRAAITLKLCAYEETGAIVAAMTTSIPEAEGDERNWDYRLCWLRDSYFTVHALNRLGATRTMEDYMRFLINVVATNAPKTGYRLQPLYSILGDARPDERFVTSLAGYRGHGPVRIGNAAYSQVQYDVYGAVILASAQAFFDRRLSRPGDAGLFERLEHVGEQAWAVHDQPDAGPWELRNSTQVHTFSALMCWAACDRLARIAAALGLGDRAALWAERADVIRAVIEERAWNAEVGAFTQAYGGRELDASMLLLNDLGFLKAEDPRFASTVDAIGRELKRGPYLFRYRVADDFGEPVHAFNICTFWYIDALAALGRREEARAMFENMLAKRNRLGLLSEHLDTETGEQWGNFPQTYSMVGLISSAMKLSKAWEDAF